MVSKTLLATSAVLGLSLVAGVKADAAVRFHYVGGRWSHSYHRGWHRYWGGPSIGFYYAPAPVYVVPGYADPYYYDGPDFWYSRPEFGLSLNFGGGDDYYVRHHRSGYRYHDYGHRWHDYDRDHHRR